MWAREKLLDERCENLRKFLIERIKKYEDDILRFYPADRSLKEEVRQYKEGILGNDAKKTQSYKDLLLKVFNDVCSEKNGKNISEILRNVLCNALLGYFNITRYMIDGKISENIKIEDLCVRSIKEINKFLDNVKIELIRTAINKEVVDSSLSKMRPRL